MGDEMPYTIDDFKSGRYVYHVYYGYGTIFTVDGEKVLIGFDYGKKEWFTIQNLIKSERFRFL